MCAVVRLLVWENFASWMYTFFYDFGVFIWKAIVSWMYTFFRFWGLVDSSRQAGKQQ